MVTIDVYDPYPGQFESSGAGHWGHKPSGGDFIPALFYYAWTKGPLGLLDPGNLFEANYWAQRYGWKGAAAVTATRAMVVPIVAGIMFDPDHVWDKGLDDSMLAIADARRRYGGSPLSHHEGVIGSPGAWSMSNRSV